MEVDATPDDADTGADGARLRRSGPWNDHSALAVTAFMEAARATGFTAVHVVRPNCPVWPDARYMIPRVRYMPCSLTRVRLFPT